MIELQIVEKNQASREVTGKPWWLAKKLPVVIRGRSYISLLKLYD
jgi:hypothetical protein